MECKASINGFRKTLPHSIDHCGPTAKRISLKAISDLKGLPSASQIFEDSCLKLQKATKAVFLSEPVESTLEELYRNVEDICAQRMVMELYSIGFQLSAVAHCWGLYCKKMVSSFVTTLMFLAPNQKYISFHGQTAFDTRSSEFTDLLYDSIFLPEFLRKSQQLYTYEADLLTRTLNVPEYLLHVDKRIIEEEDRLVVYLDANSTRGLLMSTLVSELLTRPLDHLLDNGLVTPLKTKQTSQLSLLFSLISRVPNGIDKLRTHFRNYIIQMGREMVENPTQDPEKDRAMIQNLLDSRDFLSEIIVSCFSNDSSFMRVLQEAYEEFINQRPNKPAEFLAKYLDSHLRSGNKAQTEEELDKLMDKAMILFRFIDGKDIFEAFYTKELAKRLLLNKSASVDAEKAMLSKLKQECGPNYTRKMETMFQDIELSRQLSKNFRLSLPGTHSIELSVNVICPASWPPYPQTTANYPPEMVALREEFTRFYLSHHQGRKLMYEPSLGTCVVKAKFPTTPNLRKELQVSELQALVLLQFNQSDNAPITYMTIAENTGIEEKELKRTLLSLAAGKGQRVLIKTPGNLEIENDHQFIFNAEFRHRLTRIKFNQIQLKETEQEQVATEERVFADRVAHASDIKKRIENLIERDYMKRDSSNAATYHYVS
ncbi:Cullin-4B [Schistosoma japonicum]|nr:Cullin-4B [Schistosoma japonicum]